MGLYAYALYFGLTGWVVLTTWPGAAVTKDRRERQVVALLMGGLPVVIAGVLTYALMRNNDWAAGLYGVFFGGLIVLAIGIVFRSWLPGHSSVAWRLSGWTAAAGVLLIPASTALLCWIPGLIAYVVPGPEGWLRRSPGPERGHA